jgi:hypothetical protein
MSPCQPQATESIESFQPHKSFQPHMHLRGKAMMVQAILPTGQKQVISLVSDFKIEQEKHRAMQATAVQQ